MPPPKPSPRKRDLLDGSTFEYMRGTFFRGTRDTGEHDSMNGRLDGICRLISGKHLAGHKPPDLRDLDADDVFKELVARESFEGAGGRNTSSHFVPVSMKASVSSGFAGGQNQFAAGFEIDFVLYNFSLEDDAILGLPGIRSFIAARDRFPRDIFPLFLGNPAEMECFAYTGTAIYLN